MEPYDHRAIEAKWQDYWEERETFATPTDRTRPKYYVLDMFPYPSGAGLHVGHPKGYVATDVVARARRMMGFNVLRVMGWDSFGLPAERQADKEGAHPRDITERNIKTFKLQLRRLGLSYDWKRELATSSPEYYKWTQWIFLELFKAGLAFQAEIPVNWCPALGTVLANEEVKDGRYVETGDLVEQRRMKQWMLKITAYAERLVDGLDSVDWPEGIKEMQRHWIGRSEGAVVRFAVADRADSFEIFTTRPDTLFGCTYCVLAPEHPLVGALTTPDQAEAVAAYRAEVGRRSDRDRMSQAVDAPKTGCFTGAYAINPVNGQRVPIWIADYVLASYGSGAVFACPAHDERDHAFARAFGLPIVRVVEGGPDVAEAAYTGDGPHVASAFLDGLDITGAKRAIITWLTDRGAGHGTIQYRLRDWLFSRQRYWGEPFPLVFRDDGTPVPVPVGDLPVALPEIAERKATEDGRPPLARAVAWMQATDPTTGLPAVRETNTMPQWAGSCWYYLRFISPDRSDVPWDREEERYWMPVDLYVGGAEHATLHLLYARFWHQVLYDLGHVSTPEPFQRLYNQGMIHATSYRDAAGRYWYPEEVEVRDGVTVSRATGVEVFPKMEKMSKSKYNVVNPDDMCERYGADAMRLYELFMGPLEDGALWETSGVAGTRRFLDRLWRLAHDEKVSASAVASRDLDRALHQAIRRVTDAVESLKFNTAISDMMVYVNEATKAAAVPAAHVDALVRIVAPFAPHLAEELWAASGHHESVTYAPWPEWDEAKLAVDLVTVAVQVSGKLRGQIDVAVDAAEADVLAAAKALPDVARWIEGKQLVREVYVPGRIVNLVVR